MIMSVSRATNWARCGGVKGTVFGAVRVNSGNGGRPGPRGRSGLRGTPPLYGHGDVRVVQHVRHGTVGTTAIVAELLLTPFTLANDGSDRPFVLAGLIVLVGIGLRIEAALREERYPARRPQRSSGGRPAVTAETTNVARAHCALPSARPTPGRPTLDVTLRSERIAADQ